MKAWYFSTKEKRLRYNDRRLIERGKMHTIKGEPSLCQVGLHGSLRIIDALAYSPGSFVWYVDISRKVDKGEDKICGQRRKYIWGFDATSVLLSFARKQALINIEKIKPYCSPKDYIVILDYLKTGKEELKRKAYSAADSAARSATYSAAYSAADSLLEEMIIKEAKRLGFIK